LNTLDTPTLRRRFASMVYEAILLFGVLFIAGWLFSTLLQQRHALYLRNAFQVWLMLVMGVYFVWLWTHGGQTLPMKTWRIRLVTKNGQHVTVIRAICRYLLAWSWVMPGLALALYLDSKSAMLILIPLANLLLWALTVYLDPQRQFLHDRLAGTRLVNVTIAPADKPAASSNPAS
jgi:uncharacterized RDD family membrane protein YckC